MPVLPAADLERVLAPGRARMLPAAAYLDEGVLAWERRHLFDGGWVCLGRVDLPEPGSQRAVAAGDTTILVVRDADEVLRGFFNVCRHRASELLQSGEAACAAVVRCPYHAWTYNLDGSLRHAPRFDLPLDGEDLGLTPVAVEAWHGWLFANLDGSAAPFAEHVAGLDARVAPYRPADLVVAATSEYEVAANWKTLSENYHECYHCASIHPELVRISPPDSGANAEHPAGAWIGGTMQLVEGAQTMSLDGSSGGRTLLTLDAAQQREVGYYQLLPNLFVSLHPDYVMTHRLVPLAAGTTRVACTWLFPADVAGEPGFDPSYAVEFWDLVNRQDWAACESVQRGLASPGYRPGPLGPREDAVEQFVRAMAKGYLAADHRTTAAPDIPAVQPHRSGS